MPRVEMRGSERDFSDFEVARPGKERILRSQNI